MTYLHKTNHKSPNIKWQKIAFLSKNVKNVLFFVFIKTTFIGKDFFKIFVFYIILLDFSSICGFFESCKMVLFLLWSFFSFLWDLRFDVFTVFKIPYLWITK